MKLRGLLIGLAVALLATSSLGMTARAVDVGLGLDWLTSQGPELAGFARFGNFGAQVTVMPVYRSDPYFTTRLIGTGTMMSLVGKYHMQLGPVEAYLGLGGSLMSLSMRLEDPDILFPPSSASTSGLAAMIGAQYALGSMPVRIYAGATYLTFSDIQVVSGGEIESVEFQSSGIGFHFGVSYTFSFGSGDKENRKIPNPPPDDEQHRGDDE